MTTQHKHAAFIKAWADGAKIQYLHIIYGWTDVPKPSWLEDTEYRIKPEPKPDIVFYQNYYENKDVGLVYKTKEDANNYYCSAENKRIGMLQITIDGETGKPKSAEIIN